VSVSVFIFFGFRTRVVDFLYGSFSLIREPNLPSIRRNIGIDVYAFVQTNECNRLERGRKYILLRMFEFVCFQKRKRVIVSLARTKDFSQCYVFWLANGFGRARKFASPFWRDSRDRTNRACNPPLVTLRPVTLLYKREQRWNDVCKIQIEIRRGRSVIARHPQRNPPPGRKYDFLVSSSYFFAVASRTACGTR